MTVKAALLKDRGVIAVGGEEAASFLQGLLTNDVERLEEGEARYAGLLSPQGKILFDMLVVRAPSGSDAAFLIDCAAEQAADLARRLGFYKLRSKVSIADQSGARAVVAYWGEEPDEPPDSVLYADPRDPRLGWRAILPRDKAVAIGDEHAPTYEALRIGAGVPKGGADFIYGDAFPHDANFDLLHGVDFDKGCYVGQEVVSRMKHRGTARKRVARVKVLAEPASPGTPVLDGELAGRDTRLVVRAGGARDAAARPGRGGEGLRARTHCRRRRAGAGRVRPDARASAHEAAGMAARPIHDYIASAWALADSSTRKELRAPETILMIEGISVFALVVVAFIVVTALMGVRQVPQGYNYTVERFGRYHKTLTPGLGLIFPYIDSVGHKLNVMEQVIDVPRQEIITKDNATVSVDGVVFFQVLDARRASYEIANLQFALLNLVTTNVRTVMGSMDLDQLLSHRDEINARLLNVIDAASEPWGVKVTRIEIKDIEPPKDLVNAMARQMKAEREKRAVILEAEGMRQSDITRAEGRKAAVVLEAEGRRDAAFRAAEAVERTAQAEAAATRMMSEATSNGDVVAVNFLIAEKYINALQTLAQSPNQKTVIVPIELASLAGMLGGIGQIAAGALGEFAVSRASPGAFQTRTPAPVPDTAAPAAPPAPPPPGGASPLSG